ncbi:Polygalacturonase 1 [Dionaea muscipula]
MNQYSHNKMALHQALNLFILTLILLSMSSSSSFCSASYELSIYNNINGDHEELFAFAPEPSISAHIHSPNEAFENAWKKACSTENGIFRVPALDTFKLKPITLSGPCNSHTTFMIYGKIEASEDIADYEKDQRHWLVFEDVDNLRVEGGGTIDGNGKIWWERSCKWRNSTAMTFRNCNNLAVDNLIIRNAQQMHISFQSCNKVVASNLMISAPGHSPNTDGIHLTRTKNIKIINSLIRTGDDCISIVSGSQHVQATDITCGPGHGISIGSLGEGDSEAHVSDISVNRAKLSGTTNGVRIKTWQGGSGRATNIQFQNIQMKDVKHPIIIDQNYCDNHRPCPSEKSAVKVRNVYYKNIRGTSLSKTAITFNCSESVPCSGILLEDVNLSHGGDEAEADCRNVKLVNKGDVSPKC